MKTQIRHSKTMFVLTATVTAHAAPCGLRGWKNTAAPYPGRMS